MKISYTVFHSKEYGDHTLGYRSNNVDLIHRVFKDKIDYIHNDVILIKDLLSYKNILKSNKDLRRVSIRGNIRFGAVGLTFTTFLAYQKFLKSDSDVFLVFEDDAQIKDNAYEALMNYLLEVPKDFDILSLYENKYFYKKYNSSHDLNLQNICKAYNDRSTLVYAISRSGVIRYLEYFEDVVDLPIDLYLFDSNKNTKQYAIKPTSYQPFYSDFFEENGDPDYDHSSINKTKEFRFG